VLLLLLSSYQLVTFIASCTLSVSFCCEWQEMITPPSCLTSGSFLPTSLLRTTQCLWLQLPLQLMMMLVEQQPLQQLLQ
jgi:hypothetical protein